MENSKGNEITLILSRILSQKADELGLTLRDIQEISGVSHSTIGRIFKGETAIDIDKFSAVAKALGLAPWRVFRQAERELAEGRVAERVEDIDPVQYVQETEAKLASITDFEIGLAAHGQKRDQLQFDEYAE